MGMTHWDGISVCGSGLAIGKKYAESYVGMSGADGLVRFDASWVTTSGVLAGVSTRLSTIVTAFAQYVGTVKCSGQDNIYINFSGGAFDLTLHTGIGTPTASSLVLVTCIGK